MAIPELSLMLDLILGGSSCSYVLQDSDPLHAASSGVPQVIRQEYWYRVTVWCDLAKL